MMFMPHAWQHVRYLFFAVIMFSDSKRVAIWVCGWHNRRHISALFSGTSTRPVKSSIQINFIVVWVAWTKQIYSRKGYSTWGQKKECQVCLRTPTQCTSNHIAPYITFMIQISSHFHTVLVKVDFSTTCTSCDLLCFVSLLGKFANIWRHIHVYCSRDLFVLTTKMLQKWEITGTNQEKV